LKAEIRRPAEAEASFAVLAKLVFEALDMAERKKLKAKS
jgi:predicted outer membrane lipoprotein